MIAYIDTHVAVWLASGMVPQISPPAQAMIERSDLLLPAMALLELEYLHEVGRLLLPAQDIVRKLTYEIGLRVCDLSFATIAVAAVEEHWTRDPFDRLIVANAKANGLARLISADDQIARHYPRTVW